MVSSVPGKAAVIFAFCGLAVIVASVAVVDWVYASESGSTYRIGLWQLYKIETDEYFDFPSGTVSIRIEAGRGCMVSAAALAFVGVVVGVAYLILKDPWGNAKRYVLIMYTLSNAFSALLCCIGPALIYDPSNHSTYSSWSISASGILAFVGIFLEAVATLLCALEWRWYDRTFGYNLLNTDPELLQDLRDYWQARGRWEERQVIDEDWAIYRYLQQRRREQNYRLKRALKVEKKKVREREIRRNRQPVVTPGAPSMKSPHAPTTHVDDLETPPGFFPDAGRSVRPS